MVLEAVQLIFFGLVSVHEYSFAGEVNIMLLFSVDLPNLILLFLLRRLIQRHGGEWRRASRRGEVKDIQCARKVGG